MPTTRVNDLITIAARLSGVPEREITGAGRFRYQVMVRQAVARVAILQGQHSTPQIGRCLGGRDHSTVIHSNAAAIERAKRNPEYAEFIKELLAEAERAEPFIAKDGPRFEFCAPGKKNAYRAPVRRLAKPAAKPELDPFDWGSGCGYSMNREAFV